MFKEILFLKALFEHKRSLWWFSFPFHFGMYLLIGAAALLVLGGIGTVAGVCESRPLDPQPGPAPPGRGRLCPGDLGRGGSVRHEDDGEGDGELHHPGHLLQCAPPGSHVRNRHLGRPFPSRTSPARSWVSSEPFFTADMSVQLAGVLKAHFLLAFIFLAYLPFTQMMHFVAKYFTYHEVRWDDRPVEAGGKMEKELIGAAGANTDLGWGPCEGRRKEDLGGHRHRHRQAGGQEMSERVRVKDIGRKDLPMLSEVASGGADSPSAAVRQARGLSLAQADFR